MKLYSCFPLRTVMLVTAVMSGIILFAPSANAIGDTEAGILYGLGIYKIYDVITEEKEWKSGQVYSQDQEFPPFRCRGDSIKCAYERGLYEREREEWQDAKNKAYECGRYGRNCE